MKASVSGRLIGYGVLFACIIASLWLVQNRQYVLDQLAFSQYQPSSEIASLATRSGMADEGRFYFYVSNPKVNGSKEFNSLCPRAEQKSAILGCYTPEMKIHVFDVPNAQLDVIKEVTASHEMLHAAWDRLSDAERRETGILLESEYKKQNNPELNARMEYYARAEPAERTNELHSIIGTEFVAISPELEAYYRQYFSDRQAVVTLHQGYEKVFKDLEAASQNLLAQVRQLKSEVDGRLEAYNANREALGQEGDAIQAQYASLNRSSGSEVNAYNSRVNTYNSQLRLLNSEHDQIVSLIDQYNARVVAYNNAVTNQQNLQKSIDSAEAPAPIGQSI